MNLSSKGDKFPYIYRGVVKSIDDPLNIGRCRIHVPDIYGVFDYDVSLLPWSRPITGQGAKIPSLDEIVWVMFEDGNKQSPVYMTGVVTTKNPLDSTDIDIIYQYGSCKIYYNKKTGEFFLTNGDTTIYSKDDTIDLRGPNVLVNGEEIGSGGTGGGGSGRWDYEIVKVIT